MSAKTLKSPRFSRVRKKSANDKNHRMRCSNACRHVVGGRGGGGGGGGEALNADVQSRILAVVGSPKEAPPLV